MLLKTIRYNGEDWRAFVGAAPLERCTPLLDLIFVPEDEDAGRVHVCPVPPTLRSVLEWEGSTVSDGVLRGMLVAARCSSLLNEED